jgi:hypothetical protein
MRELPDVTDFGTESGDLNRLRERITSDVVAEFMQRLGVGVPQLEEGERKVKPKRLPAIAPYEVAITYRGDSERHNRTQSVAIRFGREVSPLLRGIRHLEILTDADEIRLRGHPPWNQAPGGLLTYAVPWKHEGKAVHVEGYLDWVKVVASQGFTRGMTRRYYPQRGGDIITLRPVEDFEVPLDPQQVIHV